MIVDGVDRRACNTSSCVNNSWREGVDWVLYPNTKYTRVDGTEIGSTTESALFSLPLTNSFSELSGTNSYTGLKTDWTVGEHCSEWTSYNEEAHVADAGLSSVGGISHMANASCVSSLYLICVEE